MDEHCTLTKSSDALSLTGTVLGADESVPVRVDYRVVADPAGFTSSASVEALRGFQPRVLDLARDASGRWTVDGSLADRLDGCTDVDLGCSPATNTLPIRRLQLAVGDVATIRAALVQFPDLTVVASTQTYARLGESSYGYASGSFEGELIVDDDGLVVDYDQWRRTGEARWPGA